MTNLKRESRRRRSEKLWLPSLLLLLGQFLTITPALLIVIEYEEQRQASDRYVTVLEELDRLSFSVAELDNVPARERSSWQQRYSTDRGELNRALSEVLAPEVQQALPQVDALLERTSRNDKLTARTALLDAERSVRKRLSATGRSMGRLNNYLKALVGGACLLAFGVVFLVRKFRMDAEVQKQLEEELRTSNDEVVTALAAARSESEAKNQFLAHIGNFMRPPLKAIAGKTEELLAMELTGRQRDSVQTSHELAESLGTVARQIVDYSKIASGGLQLQSVEFEPAVIVSEVVQLFNVPVERKGLKLKSSIADGLRCVVKGDPERLQQVLINFMSNAVRFTERGEILLRAEDVQGTEGRTSLRFQVKDTGIGISEHAREQIFQPFTGFNGFTKQGSGLGLPISKKLVELMGGKIEVGGEPGRGCSFTFTAVFETVSARSERRREVPEGAFSGTNVIATVEAPGNTVTAPPLTTKNPKAKVNAERRSEPRHGINYPTLLRSEEAGVSIIRILDVSTKGLRVSVPFRLKLESEVEIRIEGASVVGTVRNCTPIADKEFHVGIALRPVSGQDEQFLHHLSLLRAQKVTQASFR